MQKNTHRPRNLLATPSGCHHQTSGPHQGGILAFPDALPSMHFFPTLTLPFLAFVALVATSVLSDASPLKWHHSYSEALAEAKQSKKPIFLALAP